MTHSYESLRCRTITQTLRHNSGKTVEVCSDDPKLLKSRVIKQVSQSQKTGQVQKLQIIIRQKLRDSVRRCINDNQTLE